MDKVKANLKETLSTIEETLLTIQDDADEITKFIKNAKKDEEDFGTLLQDTL